MTNLKCEVCENEPAVGVSAVPGIPYSAAYGRECIAANAHPYGIVVANTAMLGGLDHAAEWWVWMVEGTLKKLGITREKFDADVAEGFAEINSWEETPDGQQDDGNDSSPSPAGF